MSHKNFLSLITREQEKDYFWE